MMQEERLLQQLEASLNQRLALRPQPDQHVEQQGQRQQVAGQGGQQRPAGAAGSAGEGGAAQEASHEAPQAEVQVSMVSSSGCDDVEEEEEFWEEVEVEEVVQVRAVVRGRAAGWLAANCSYLAHARVLLLHALWTVHVIICHELCTVLLAAQACPDALMCATHCLHTAGCCRGRNSRCRGSASGQSASTHTA